MDFYNDQKTAEQYISMAEGFDGRELIDALATVLPEESRVLELGMGPGVDLRLLREKFNATGSDNSRYFVERFRGLEPDADIIELDAVTLATDRQFDCIYSNKVLHHLTTEELATSLARQRQLLPAGGLIMHSFWRGAEIEEHAGMLFVQQTEDSIRSLVEEHFEVRDIVVYAEMQDDDSLYVIATAR